MEMVIFIVLAAVWAVFLIPSFTASRKAAPINSTQDFARSAERLGAVRVMATVPHLADRRRTLARRRRTLVFLTGLAVVTLAAAIWTGSVALLGVSLAVDVLLAAYITVLLYIKQRQAVPPVVALESAPSYVTSEQAEVRVVAG